MRLKFCGLLMLIFLSSCASKKDVLYLQDADNVANTNLNYTNATIQPNDILKISIESLEPEAALIYNKGVSQNVQVQSLELLQLNGYLVSIDNTINIPNLGDVSTANLTTQQLATKIKLTLTEGGFLKNPSVNVRLINAKVTVLGEVNKPGTYNFTEQNITLLQALGYANDLTINGKRNDILITREVDGVRKVAHIDLTSAEFLNSEFYIIKPNDVIVVNPNNPKVKKAGFVGDVGTILTIASLALSVTILLTR